MQDNDDANKQDFIINKVVCMCRTEKVISFQQCSGQRPLMEDYVEELYTTFMSRPNLRISPISAVWDGTKFIIYDGQHRYWAYKRACAAGKHIKVYIMYVSGTESDAVELYLNGIRQRPQYTGLLDVEVDRLPLIQRLIGEYETEFGTVYISKSECRRPKIDIIKFVDAYIKVMRTYPDFIAQVHNFNKFCSSDSVILNEIRGLHINTVADIERSQVYIRGIGHNNYKKYWERYKSHSAL